MFQPLKRIFSILLQFLVVYIFLVLLWQVIKPFYLPIFHVFGNTVFGQFGEYGEVHFKPLSHMQLTVNDEVDTKVIYTHRQLPSSLAGASLLSIQYTSYVPTVAVIALILVTPIGWSRKSWALLGGLILIHSFIIFSVFIHLLAGFNQSKTLGLISLSPFWEQTLLAAHKIFVVEITPKFIIAIFIWMLVILPYNGWRLLAEQFHMPLTVFSAHKAFSRTLSPPGWLVARTHLKEIQLSWEAVTQAEHYHIYRQSPGEPLLTLHKTTHDNFFTETIKQEGMYTYAIKAVNSEKMTSDFSQCARIDVLN